MFHATALPVLTFLTISQRYYGRSLFVHLHHRLPAQPFLRHYVISATDSSGDIDHFSTLCKLLGVHTTATVRENDAGVRGLYLESSEANCGDVLLSIPLSSCLRDDKPPVASNSYDNDYFSPNQWATRLASSLLNLRLRKSNDDSVGRKQGHHLWMHMLPEKSTLRASLPVHWTDDMVSCTNCQALELAVDSAYFTRAAAVLNLMGGLKGSSDFDATQYSDKHLSRLCHEALDVVQTRTCQVKLSSSEKPLRILAPIFDFINHGVNAFPKSGCPNAGFTLESDALVVRATKQIFQSEEILISYGDSAEPAWRCLLNYGFIPNYDNQDERNVVELLINGVRANIRPGDLPFVLVQATEKALAEEGENEFQTVQSSLNSAVAYRIAKEAEQTAWALLEQPDIRVLNKEDEYSLRLATAFRKSQHDVLTSWSLEFQAFARTIGLNS